MTELHLALLASGATLPSQTKRIWVWLKDHQPQTAKCITAALHLPEASSLLSQMEKRRMVTSTKEFDRSSGFTTKRYSTVGREYELLPMPLKCKPMVQPCAVTHMHHVPAVEPIAPPAIQIVATTVKFDLDTLTIAEARALFTRLARMFKGETA